VAPLRRPRNPRHPPVLRLLPHLVAVPARRRAGNPRQPAVRVRCRRALRLPVRRRPR
jgi:hypothetical protein